MHPSPATQVSRYTFERHAARASPTAAFRRLTIKWDLGFDSPQRNSSSTNSTSTYANGPRHRHSSGKGSAGDLDAPSLTILAVTTRKSMEQLRCWTQWMHDMQQADSSTSYSLIVHHHQVVNSQANAEYASGTAAKASAILKVATSLARERRAEAQKDMLLLTDLDVVPLRPYRLLFRHLEQTHNGRRVDLCFMREPFGSRSGYVNTGFILMRPTEPVLAFLRAWRGNLTTWDGIPSDQLVANRLLWGWKAVSNILRLHLPSSLAAIIFLVAAARALPSCFSTQCVLHASSARKDVASLI